MSVFMALMDNGLLTFLGMCSFQTFHKKLDMFHNKPNVCQRTQVSSS